MTRAGVSATKFRSLLGACGRRGPQRPTTAIIITITPSSRSRARKQSRSQHGSAGITIHHSLKEIADAIERSALSRAGKDRARHLFDRLAEAEAAIHAIPSTRIHLHEVGALDSIIDIVGVVYGMEWLGIDE